MAAHCENRLISLCENNFDCYYFLIDVNPDGIQLNPYLQRVKQAIYK